MLTLVFVGDDGVGLDGDDGSTAVGGGAGTRATLLNQMLLNHGMATVASACEVGMVGTANERCVGARRQLVTLRWWVWAAKRAR